MEVVFLFRLLCENSKIDNKTANTAEASLERFRKSNAQKDLKGVLCEGQDLFLQEI
jgi:hypothetical protein